MRGNRAAETISMERSGAETDRSSTVWELVMPKLAGLCNGLGLGHLEESAGSLLSVLAGDFLTHPAGGRPAWATDLTDDGTPFEFSVAFDGAMPELRLLAEPQTATPSPESTWEAGLALNSRLVEQYGVSLDRFRTIEELFSPLPSIPHRFLLWHSAVLSATGNIAFKIYLNPQVVGRAGSRRLVEHALDKLGMSSAARFLRDHVPHAEDPLYFALDLDSAPEARVKVYFSVARGDGEALERRLAREGVVPPGHVAHCVHTLTGGRSSDDRPLLLCYAFRETRELPEATVHVPIRSHVDNDAEALDRAGQLLDDKSRQLLVRGVEAMAQRPLEIGRSLITYVSLRWRTERHALGETLKVRVTTYLSPELYAIAAPRQTRRAETPPLGSYVREIAPSAATKSGRTFDDVVAAIGEHQDQFGQHPFFQSLKTANPTECAPRLIKQLAFFVVASQDVLRLVRETTTDRELVERAGLGELGGSGLESWYLLDAKLLSPDCGLAEVFSADNDQVRRVLYRQVADVLTAKGDKSRLAVALALEAGAAALLARVVHFASRAGIAQGGLFRRDHGFRSEDLEVFAPAARRQICGMALSEGDLAEISVAVERTFQTLRELADDLERRLRELTASESV